jgi:alanine racemase
MAACPHLLLEGIFSHLASSEHLDEANERQWLSFQGVLKALAAADITVPLRHMSNSGAILNYRRFDLDMVRPGLMSYGIYPSPETRERADLLPVMSFKTRVVLLKDFPAGYGIGYNLTYITSAPTTIATIPVGYGDGYGVILSNQGEALVRGHRAPVVGRVSMDMCTLDVTRVPGCRVGDEVVLLGEQGNQRISVNDVAERVKTNAYEILCTLGKRAPRSFSRRARRIRFCPACGGSMYRGRKNPSPASTPSSVSAFRRGREARRWAMPFTGRCLRTSSARKGGNWNCGSIFAMTSPWRSFPRKRSWPSAADPISSG